MGIRRIFSFKPAAAIFLAAAAIVAVAAPDAGAQTRRKRVPTAPSPTPPVVTGDAAQIISRASDYQDPDAQMILRPDDKKAEIKVSDPDENAKALADLRARIAGLETSGKGGSRDDKQKRLLLNLDILNRAEQRSESLRKQLFDMMEKESTIKTRLDIIELNLRPEAIEREVSLAGTMRPEDLRAMKKKQLELERTNLQGMLSEIQRTKASLDQNLQRSDAMVEKLRVRMEKEIDDALDDDPSKP